MAFPSTPLPITVELNLDGTWTDISSDVYERDAIRITRGRSDWGQQVDHGRCQFTLNNQDGKYTPRNPNSPYYGQIGRNTPVRVSVDAGDAYLNLPDTGNGYASTPDTAALDITGDLDIRIEVALDNWHEDGTVIELASKYQTSGDNRSWYFRMTSGVPGFAWSTDGTFAAVTSLDATEPIIFPPGNRIALRATMDVDNLAGGHTVTFYTSDSISGEWTRLGDPRTVAGTTSIFSGAAQLEVGTASGLAGTPASGRVYAFQLLNGILGSTAADIDFTAQTVGDTSFVGDDGLTWTVQGDASIMNRKTRFLGEISSWPVRWSAGGKDVHVAIEAAGIMRRLQKGTAPLQSTLRRRIPSDPNLLAYWPMEDGENATQAASALSNVRAMATTGLDYASIDTLAGSSPLPTLDSQSGAQLAQIIGYVPTDDSGEWLVEHIYKQDNPGGSTTTRLRITTTGTVREWLLRMSSTGGNVLGRDADGATIVNDSFVWAWTTIEPFNDWYRMRFAVTPNGSDIEYSWSWVQVDDSSTAFSNPVTSASVGRVVSVGSPTGGYDSSLDGMAIGHIAVFNETTTTIFDFADNGYSGESAGDRIERLAEEEDVTLWMHGSSDRQELMGPQKPEQFMDILRSAADADQGILYEEREVVALGYRDRASFYNQDTTLTLNYTGDDGLVTPLDPVDDDQHVRNDVTVSRTDGSSARVTQEEGPLSILPPPNGIGVYQDAVTRNLYRDAQAEHAAGWMVHLGTWDDTRYPSVSMLLQNATHLIEDASAVDVGSRIAITNPPSWLPPDTIDLMVQGYTELLHQFRWELEWNCTPALPWTVAVVENPVNARAGTSGSELSTAVNTTDTSLIVSTTSGPLWITSASHPSEDLFDIKLGGEVATVTAITGVAEDAFDDAVASGWGTADSGQTWVTDGGAATDYAVTGGTGRHLMPLTTFLATVVPVTTADVDLTVDFSLDAAPTGDSAYVFPVLRYIDTTHFYFARVQIASTGAMTLTLRKRDGAETQLGSSYATGFTYTAGTWYTIRVAVTGSTLSAKVWLRGATEPAAWQLTESDSALTAAGSVGVRSLLGGSSTNAVPLTMQFDNLTVSPQKFTVSRSINSVSKSHAAGTAIALATPAVIAL